MGQRRVSRFRASWRLVALAAAALTALAVVPAVGEHLPSGEAEGGAGILRLHVGTDGRYFQYEPPGEDPPHQRQDIFETRCEIELEEAPALASLSGNARGPGLNGISIGVKSGGSQGVPCGRIDASEELTVGLEDVPLAAEADLDLELKKDAKVKIEVYLGGTKSESFEIRSGSSIVQGEGVDGSSGEPFTATVETDDPETGVDESIANCKNQSDSGPDAGARDNCRVTVHPSLPFDAIQLVPTVGEISLEGSGDFGDDPAFDTIFHLTTFEGVIGCGDTDSDSVGEVDGTITRHSNADGSLCVVKPYRLLVDTEDDSLVFEIGDPASQPAVYEAVVTFVEESDTPPFTMTLEYDPEPPYGDEDTDTGFKEAPACEKYPFEVDENGDDEVDSDGAKTLVSGAIPEGHEACVISVTQEWDGTTTWHAVFQGDWKFR